MEARPDLVLGIDCTEFSDPLDWFRISTRIGNSAWSGTRLPVLSGLTATSFSFELPFFPTLNPDRLYRMSFEVR